MSAKTTPAGKAAPEKMTPYRLFLAAAREICKEVKVIKKQPRLVKLTFNDGATLFLTGLPRLNEQGAREITRDKEMTVRVMESEAIPTPQSHLFYLKHGKEIDTVKKLRATPEYLEMRAFLKKVGFPVFMKPNKGSQGKGVVRIVDREALDEQLLKYSHNGRRSVPLVQEALHGEEHRVVIMFGEILLGVHRRPFDVEGDGKSTIDQLIRARLKFLKAQGRKVKLKATSPKITSCLEQQGYDRDTVLKKGKTATVIANKNLSDGAMPVMSTDTMRERYSDLARKIYQTLGVKFVGIDLIEDNRTGKIVPYVLEVNSNPGFAQFMNSSPKHAAALKEMYGEVIQRLHRRKRIEARFDRAARHSAARQQPAKATTDGLPPPPPGPLRPDNKPAANDPNEKLAA